MRELLWRAVARVVTIPAVTDWLIRRAQRTPYTNITSRDGTSTYMVRLWLFNPYPADGDKEGWAAWARTWRRHLPSVRVHHILKEDDDGACHDHPWNARTIVLRGWYCEERPAPLFGGVLRPEGAIGLVRTDHGWHASFWRERGYTGRLLFGQYHRISRVPPEGVWTLFITWKKQGTWGFLVDGVKVPWRKYLGLEGS